MEQRQKISNQTSDTTSNKEKAEAFTSEAEKQIDKYMGKQI